MNRPHDLTNDLTRREDELISRELHGPHDPNVPAGRDLTPDLTPLTPPDLTFVSPFSRGTTRDAEVPDTPATDRKADRRAVRAVLARRRQYGLARRHAAKAEHWQREGLPDHLAALQAKVDARTTTDQLTEETESARHPDQSRLARVRHTGVMQPITAAERKRLVETVGAVLRVARIDSGWSIRRLARAIGCAPSTVYRLEHGLRRPRRCLLRVLATVLAVDDPDPLTERLIAAAGESLVADTPGALRRRHRRANAALLAGYKPWPTEIANAIRLHRAADAAWGSAMAMLDQMFAEPSALDDPVALDRVLELTRRHRSLRDEAGDPMTLVVGNHMIKVGLGR